MLRLAPITCTLNIGNIHNGAIIAAYRFALTCYSENLMPLIIVNQGTPSTVFGNGKDILVLNQKNYGGAGGFTRGIIEAKNRGATHFLLMDDDAIPCKMSIVNVINYYFKNPNDRNALHGTMYSLTNPETIYEAGGWVTKPESKNFGSTRRLAGYKVNEEKPENDCELWKNMDIDYGAWWFFACPMQAVSEVGLPLPLFIRGDDREYGRRLKKAGIKTLPLPNLRVWHPEHGDKLSSWYLYFVWRNNFIEKALHADVSTLSLTCGILKKIFFRTMGYQYDTIAYILAGIRSYLQGPSCLQSNPKNDIEYAKSIETKFPITYQPLDDTGEKIILLTPQTSFREELCWIFLLNGFWQNRKKSAFPIFTAASYHWLNVRGCSRYAIFSQTEKRMRIYHRDLLKVFYLFLATLATLLQFIVKNNHIKKKWKKNFHYLVSFTFWEEYLELSKPFFTSNPDFQ